MAFILESVRIEKIIFGNRRELLATLNGGSVLVVDPHDLVAYLSHVEPRIKEIKVHLAEPGDNTRIICVKDVIEPRSRIIASPEESSSAVGIGRTVRLENAAIVTCGQLIAAQEGMIDMSGPGAKHSPFSRTRNIVLEMKADENLSLHQKEEAMRRVGLIAARYVGNACNNLFDKTEAFALETEPRPGEIPWVVYIYPLLAQGLMHDTYVLGENAATPGFLPRFIRPEAVLDSAIVSGNCVSACDKNTTYHHQNNPVIRELFNRQTVMKFAGVILTPELKTLKGKEDAAQHTVRLARAVKADAAVITKEGFGNPDADLMMIIRGLEQAGIRTVAITDEYAGSDGASQSLADTTPEADAIVSAGNANELITLSPMKKTIGPIDSLTKLAGAYPQSLHEDGSITMELQGIVGATNELGFGQLSCKEV